MDAGERLEMLKRLTGAPEEGQDALLAFLLADAENQILSYIHHETLPPALEGTAVRLAAGLWRETGAAAGAAGTAGAGAVQSVKRGDVQVTYAVQTGQSGQESAGEGAALEAYQPLLNPYRKLRW